MRIVSSAPSLLKALNRPNSGWKCIHFGKKTSKGGIMENYNKKRGKFKVASTIKRLSASFYYSGL
jgi:hypothetical protein